MNNTRAALLAVDLEDGDRRILADAAKRCDCDLISARTIHEAMQLARGRVVRVILCQPAFPDGDWRDLLNLSLSWKTPAKVIVVFRLADNRLWSEVLNLGGYDLLAAPLDGREVSHVLASACQDSYGEERTHQVESLEVPCL
jgi:DNA-binding NtrC family response regulator